MAAFLWCLTLLPGVFPGRAAWAADMPAVRGATVPAAAPQPVRVFYYHPSDHPPLPGYRQRLDKVMRHVQAFYARGMEENGWGAGRTFALQRGEDRGLIVHLVPGRLKLAEHKRGQTERFLHEDVDRALRARGLDPDRETLMVFTNLLVWRDGKAIEVGPYYGSGGPDGGWCYAYDDPLLDPDRLGSRAPGGYYVSGPCSIGEFNSHYIGGIAHELGHAFGLPHDRENAADRKRRGSALLGGGNHTYGREQRGEGPGAFMTPAEAMLLARHPRFRPATAPVAAAPRATWKTLAVRQERDTLVVTGEVTAEPRPFGVAAFNDPEGGSDYDAVSAAARLEPGGRFRLTLPDLKPGPHEMRLAVCHEDGSKSWLKAAYRIGPDGRADTGAIAAQVVWAPVAEALARDDADAVRRHLRTVRDAHKDSAAIARQARIVESWLAPAVPVLVETLAPDVKTAPVSDLAFERAEVGWGAPLRDRTPAEEGRVPFLSAGGETFAKGLFAHAPARHGLRLGGGWARLTTGFALQQGSAGSVVFVVKGDGRELFRSQAIRGGPPGRATVDVKGIDLLELITEDAGDGIASDWGVWLDPTLAR